MPGKYASAWTRAEMLPRGGQQPRLKVSIDPTGGVCFYLIFRTYKSRKRKTKSVYLEGLTDEKLTIGGYTGPVTGDDWEYILCTHLAKGFEYVCIEHGGREYDFYLTNVRKTIGRAKRKWER